MKNQHRVVWTKGMFLNPQLFQTQDQYHEDQLQSRFSVSNFANWGVSALEIDAEALINGLFRLIGARGVMPDGTTFDMPSIDALPPSRQIQEHFPATDKALSVYLAIPEQRLEASNVTIPSANQPSNAPPATRYVAETVMMADQNSGIESKAVHLARRNYRLFFESEYRDGFTCLRIAQIARNAAGAYIVHPTFIAPCLDLSHSTYLMSILRRQVEILSTKSATLSTPRRQRGRALADFQVSETADFWLLHTVNSFLPELRHIWKVRHGHPEVAYIAMLRLAGALSTFSLDVAPDDLPDYDHDALGSCFTALDARIRELMETVIPTKFVAIPLEQAEGRLWTANISDDRYLRDAQCFLAVSASMGIGDIISKVPRLMRVASADTINRLIDKALPGIELVHTPTPPSEIRVRLDNQYFSLSQIGEMWRDVVLSRRLAVYAPSEIKEPRFELVVVLK